MKVPQLLSSAWLTLLLIGLLGSVLLDVQPGRIPFLPENLAPTSAQALLGTDHLGRDIGLGLVLGIPSILVLAIPSLLLSLVIALGSGFLVAANIQLRIALLNLGLVVFSGGIILASLPWLHAFPLWMLIGLFALFFLGCALKLPGPKLRICFKEFVRLIQLVLLSVPGMLLLFSINPNSYLELILLLGGTSWVALGQFAERSMLNFFHSTAYENAKTLGIPMFRIVQRHMFRQLLEALRPQLAWLLAGFIMLEGSLGYLGVGLPAQHWGWGQMLRVGLLHPHLWWCWLFPSLCILFTVLSCFVLLHKKQN